MTTMSSLQPVVNNLFITLVVDSATPDWEELYEKYLSKVVQLLGRSTHAKARLSYVLYSSAGSSGGPIVEDRYFSRSQDLDSAIGSISGSLGGFVARPLPGGGSASLEGLVRAIEHLDLLNELEPSSNLVQKHIFFVTACPPDHSTRVLSNKNHRFDDFGWQECEEWLRERKVSLSLVVTRMPGDAKHLALYKGLNPAAVDPIPPLGPVRLYPSLRVAVLIRPLQPGQHPPGSAVPTTNSPGTTPAVTVSPNMAIKRKAQEDLQISPRRAKFPTGVSAPPGSVPTSLGQSVPTQDLSASESRPIKAVGPTGMPIGMSHATAGPQLNTIVPSGIPNRPVTQLPPNSLASNPGPARPPGTEAPDPQYALQIEKIMANGIAQAGETALKLKKMYEEAVATKTALLSQGKPLEARSKEVQAEKIKDFLIKLYARIRQQTINAAAGPSTLPMQGASQNIGAHSVNNPGIQNPQRKEQTGGISFSSAAENAAMTIRPVPSAPPVPSNPMPNNNPIPQNINFLWRGMLCITNGEGKPAISECFCYLAPAKVSDAARAAIASWPQRIIVQPIRARALPDQLVQWLSGNQPDGIFNLRPIPVDQWPTLAAKASETVVNQLQQRFLQAQNAIVDGKLVLLGSIELTGGGSNTVLLFHMPTPSGPNSVPNTQHQLIVARYPSPPSIMSIPGDAWPTQPQVADGAMKGSTPANIGANLRQIQNNTARPVIGNSYGLDNAAVKPSFLTGASGSSNVPGVSGDVSMEMRAARNFPLQGAQGLFDSLGNVNQQNLQNFIKNPIGQAQLNLLKNQHQQVNAGAASTAGIMANLNRNANNASISGATLLDRMGNQSLGHNVSYGQNSQVLQHALHQQQQQSQQSLLNSQLSGFPGNTMVNLGANQDQLLGQPGGFKQPGVPALGGGGGSMAGTSLGASNFMNNIAGLDLGRNLATRNVNPAISNAGLMQSTVNASTVGMGSMGPQSNSETVMAMATSIANQRGIPVAEVLKIFAHRQQAAGWGLSGGT